MNLKVFCFSALQDKRVFCLCFMGVLCFHVSGRTDIRGTVSGSGGKGYCYIGIKWV